MHLRKYTPITMGIVGIDEMWTGEWWWDIQVSRQSESTPMQLNVLYRAISLKAQSWHQ